MGGCTPVSESSGSEGRKTNRATFASSGQTQGESVVVGKERESKYERAIPAAINSSGVSALVCSYLVDPASSHMLVSKIKPCMCKYKH